MGDMMHEEKGAISAGLKAPRAGAIAGIVFSILLIISLVLIRLSIPDSPGDPGTWLSHSVKSIRLALELLPFAGIAFLWFMGVLRDRMGADEDSLSSHRFPRQRTPVSRHNVCLFGRYRVVSWWPTKQSLES